MEKNTAIQQQEAALSILMDLHSQQEGEQLWEAFAASREKMPKKLDRACLRIFALRERRPLYHAAVWLLSILVFGVLSICAAEAGGLLEFREPLWKGYFVTQHTDAVSVHFHPVPPTRRQDPDRIQQAIEKCLPQGFSYATSFIRTYPPENPGFYALYTDGGDGEIMLKTKDPGRGLVEIPTKNTKVDEIRYLGRDMALLTKENAWTVVWHNEEENLCYILSAQGIREAEFWTLVSALLSC